MFLLGFVVFWPLATLSKQNGALLPLLALIIEFSFFERPKSTGDRRLVHALLVTSIALPALAALISLGIDPDSLRGSYQARDFSIYERLLTEARTIYVLGQLRAFPVASFLRYLLTMLRRDARLLDSAGGLATEEAKNIGPDCVLLAVSFRHYAHEVAGIVREVAARGVPVIAITDSQLSPIAQPAAVYFEIPEDEYSFSRSIARDSAVVILSSNSLSSGVMYRSAFLSVCLREKLAGTLPACMCVTSM